MIKRGLVIAARWMAMIAIALIAACGGGGGGAAATSGGTTPAASTTGTWDQSTWDNTKFGN